MKACKMQFAREEFYSVGFGIGLQKNSTYLKAFNSALTLMIENGFVSHWEAMYWPKRNQYTECNEQPTEGQPLTIKHFISIYLVCSIVILFSLMVLIYQHIFPPHFNLMKTLRESTRISASNSTSAEVPLKEPRL